MGLPPLPVFNISTAVALSVFGDAALYTILPSYYPHIGLIPFQVGIILSINRWIRLASNHMAERFCRRYPSDFWLIFALFAGSVATAIYGVAYTFVIFLGARILWGISYSFIRQISIIITAKSGPEYHLGERMGYYRGISAMWIAAGIFLAGIGHGRFGFTFTLITLSILSLISLPLGALSQRGVKILAESFPRPLSGKGDYRISLLGFANGVVGPGMIMSTIGFILKEQVGEFFEVAGFSIGVVTMTGTFLGLRWVLMGIGAPVLGNVADRLGRRLFIYVGFMVGALDLLITGIYLRPILLIFCLLIFFLCEITLYPLLTALASQYGTRAVASFVTAVDFGMASGPLIGWSIGQAGIHAKYILIVGGIIYVSCAIISFNMWLSHERLRP